MTTKKNNAPSTLLKPAKIVGNEMAYAATIACHENNPVLIRLAAEGLCASSLALGASE